MKLSLRGMLAAPRTVAFSLGAFLWMLVNCQGVICVKIVRLSVPRWVENGTVDSVILDCEYTYTEKDRLLVVKWFLNKDPEPIYQWITEFDARHTSARLQGHINMNFMVTPSNPLTRYRALNILRPTTELSGKYSCHVVSLIGQDSREDMMTVYAPPKRFDFNYTKNTGGGANITCEADDVFPLPHMTLYRRTLQDSDKQLLYDVRSQFERTSGAYEAQVSHEAVDRTLPPEEPVAYECVLSLPGTSYQRQKNLIYYPGPVATESASTHRAQHLLTFATFVVTIYLFKLKAD